MWCTDGWYQRCLICNAFLGHYHKVREKNTRFAFLIEKQTWLLAWSLLFIGKTDYVLKKIGVLWQTCPFWINVDGNSLHRVCSDRSWNSSFITIMARTWQFQFLKLLYTFIQKKFTLISPWVKSVELLPSTSHFITHNYEKTTENSRYMHNKPAFHNLHRLCSLK